MKSLQIDRTGILRFNSKVINILSIIFGSIFIAVLAQISIQIPFSPVPITGQTLGVIIIGGILGSKKGALTISLYLMEGALGFPVFANMKAGAYVLIGPTAGYLWSFIPAAYLVGFFSEKGITDNFLISFLVCLLSTFLILILGSIYLTIIGFGLDKALLVGFYPFILGGIIKSLLGSIFILCSRKFA
jgi:biotin transport system substrate-specific component